MSNRINIYLMSSVRKAVLTIDNKVCRPITGIGSSSIKLNDYYNNIFQLSIEMI